MGVYLRSALIQGWVRLNFHHFQQVVSVFYKKIITKHVDVLKQNFNCSLKVLVKYGTKKTWSLG